VAEAVAEVPKEGAAQVPKAEERAEGPRRRGKRAEEGGAESFDGELKLRRCEVLLANGERVVGTLVPAKFWFKVLLDPGVLYINKAYVVSVRPLD